MDTAPDADRNRAIAAIPLYTIAGLAAIPFPLCNVLSLGYVDIDIERGNSSNNFAGLLFTLTYLLLLPLVYVLYQELRVASQPLSAVVAILGLLAPLGAALGLMGLMNSTVAIAMMAVGLSAWIGLAGCLALSRRVLPTAWALFSLMIGVLAVLGAVLIMVIGFSSLVIVVGGIVVLLYGLSVAIWTVWTGVLVLLRARRIASGGA